MKLRDLIAAIPGAEVRGDDGVDVGGLAYRSDRVEPGYAFFCVRGMTADGHDFAPDALKRGASVLVVDRWLSLTAPQVLVPDVRASMAQLAARFHGDPTARLRLVGVTGTNGKTTVTFLVRHVLESAGVQTGLLGTVEQVVGRVSAEVERTTPEAIDLQATFNRMLDAGDAACVMEASSHALSLGRVEELHFEAVVFTNLTQDHLDFHGDMERYFQAKRALFATETTARIVNLDDPYGRRLAEEFDCATYSVESTDADYRATDIEFDAAGARFRLSGPGRVALDVATPLPGHFNVSNSLAAVAVCAALGIDPADAARSLGSAARVPGRFEPIDEGQPFALLVDYAHTPDSLENALRAARRITPGRLICVFGCGGDRDRGKRPKMGRIAAELADLTIVTSDNPRSEDPDAIIAQILEGATGPGVEVEPDRRRAIARACAAARPGDVVVVAGKGHEQGQEFEDGRKLPFDDREVAREELRDLVAGAQLSGLPSAGTDPS